MSTGGSQCLAGELVEKSAPNLLPCHFHGEGAEGGGEGGPETTPLGAAKMAKAVELGGEEQLASHPRSLPRGGGSRLTLALHLVPRLYSYTGGNCGRGQLGPPELKWWQRWG